MRVLVTGAGGFVGPYLIAVLQAGGHEPHALDRSEPDARLRATGVPVHRGDLLDAAALVQVMEAVRPEAVVHLAGLTFVPDAARDPEAAYRINLHGTLALLAAIRDRVPAARLLHVSTGDVYGAVRAAELPVVETTPMRPLNVYATTKAAAEIAVGQWGRSHGLDVVVARPFNHTGPGQAATFVCSALARQVARAEAGEQPPVLQVGDMDPIRDFSDVRDVVAGYVALLERGRRHEIYNLCSEQGASIADVIAMLRGIARMPLAVRRDPALRRPVDVPRIVGSAAKIRADVGWQVTRSFEGTLADLVDAWRATIAAGPAQ